jgi:hypothetical protein
MTMLSRAEVVQTFLDLYECPSYLEIGVNRGDTFNNVAASIKVAVDPHLVCEQINRIDNGLYIRFFSLTSDQYFGNVAHHLDLTDFLSEHFFDVIYIDGLHTFEQVFRDLLNSIARLNPKGVIIIDDVIPSSYHASLPDLTLEDLLETPGVTGYELDGRCI